MRIGIVTFWDSEDNYGQVLQCYALQKFLLDKGHDVFLIKYRPIKKWNLRVLFSRLRMYCSKDISKFIESFTLFFKFRRIARIKAQDKINHPRNFLSFKQQYIRYTDKIYNQYELSANPPKADAYIAGSDQIWSGVDSVFFLDFAPKGTLRIAYAPSFGRNDASVPTLIAKYLSKLDVVTVREQEGISICRQLGRIDASLVPDPTFLLSANQYAQISSPISCEDNFIFLYILGNDMNFDISNVYKWGKEQGLVVRYVASQGKTDSYAKEYPNVDEWIFLMTKAKYVVTNSFHGMVMSIILNKKFVVIPLSGVFARMNGRILTTLNRYDLSERMIFKGELDILFREIDYSIINKMLEEQITEISSNFDLWLH